MSDVQLEHGHGGRKVLLRGTSPGTDGVLLTRSGSGKPLNNLELVEHLCAASRALAEARLQHVRNFGSLVPHVFMGDVLARVGACLTADSTRERRELRPEVEAILSVLEVAADTADRETRHVIAASFVSDGQRSAFFGELRPCLGRKLQTLLRGK